MYLPKILKLHVVLNKKIIIIFISLMNTQFMVG